jgi:carotenoid cleavage dioxygenase-like enzyme
VGSTDREPAFSPDHPFLTGSFAPILFEADASDLPIRGEVPKDLRGTLYRNSPNPQFAPRDKNYHWFLGDGMVHAFRIEDGRVSYRNRWVQTPKLLLERAAHRALFGSWGNPNSTDPSAFGKDSGVANTSIVIHAGKVFACEEAHLPFEIDPQSIASRGYWDFGGALKTGRFTRIRKSIQRPARCCSSVTASAVRSPIPSPMVSSTRAAS